MDLGGGGSDAGAIAYIHRHGAGAGLLATLGATAVVVVPVAEAGRRVTVNLPDGELVVVDDATTGVGVEPVRPSKRIV